MKIMPFAKNNNLKAICCALTFGLSLAFSIDNAAALSTSSSKYVRSPSSKSFGSTLTQWMMLHQAWYLKGQDPDAGTVGRVTLMPLPQQNPIPIPPDLPVDVFSTGSLDVALKAGSPFVIPVITLNGESYANNIIPDDEPIDLFKNSLLNADITVSLDGVTILKSPSDNQKFFYGPIFFPQPVTYNSPQFRFTDAALGDVFASAAIWSEGIGFMHKPLNVGTHTLHIIAVNKDLRYGFDNTWNITVK